MATDVQALGAPSLERPGGGPAIRAVGLVKRFGDVVAVDGVDLSIEPGELFSLLGPNGAGKTTTIRILSCLLRPSSGTATILGHDVANDPVAVKRVISISPQETAISEHLSALENLRLMAGLHGLDKATIRTRSQELLELMGLTDRAKDTVKKFSGGMKRRLSIAMALVTDPQVLYLDEPTLGLDPQARRVMWEHINDLKGTTTILLTTHYLEEADALADRIAIIDRGTIIAEGTAAELKASISSGLGTIVEADDLTFEAIEALKKVSPDLKTIEGGVELGSDEVDLYDIQDVLRPLGISVTSTYKKTVTLDDVFLQLTGKQLRE